VDSYLCGQVPSDLLQQIQARRQQRGSLLEHLEEKYSDPKKPPTPKKGQKGMKRPAAKRWKLKNRGKMERKSNGIVIWKVFGWLRWKSEPVKREKCWLEIGICEILLSEGTGRKKQTPYVVQGLGVLCVRESKLGASLSYIQESLFQGSVSVQMSNLGHQKTLLFGSVWRRACASNVHPLPFGYLT